MRLYNKDEVIAYIKNTLGNAISDIAHSDAVKQSIINQLIQENEKLKKELDELKNGKKGDKK